MAGSAARRARRAALAAVLPAALGACASGGRGELPEQAEAPGRGEAAERGEVPERGADPARPAEPEYAYRVEYYISCSVSDECRVQYIDEEGVLRARDIVGEWKMDFGADPGTRLWVRAGAGGCPPRPVRAEIRMEGEVVAEHLAPAPRRSRCSWILAETEFRLP